MESPPLHLTIDPKRLSNLLLPKGNFLFLSEALMFLLTLSFVGWRALLLQETTIIAHDISITELCWLKHSQCSSLTASKLAGKKLRWECKYFPPSYLYCGRNKHFPPVSKIMKTADVVNRKLWRLVAQLFFLVLGPRKTVFLLVTPYLSLSHLISTWLKCEELVASETYTQSLPEMVSQLTKCHYYFLFEYLGI